MDLEIWFYQRGGHVPKQRGPWSPSGQSSDLAGEPELDRVDNSALARPVRARNCEFILPEIKVELSNPSHFFNVDGLKLDHLRSPPTGAENIFTKSSDFTFLPSAGKARS